MTKNTLPKEVKFFLADDIRAENASKPMLIGFYPDNIVRASMSNGQPKPTNEAPITFHSLAILVALIDCAGFFDAEISLYQPNGKALLEPKKLDEGLRSTTAMEDKTNIYFIANFMPFTVPEFGIYKFVIKLDGTAYEHKFEVTWKLQQ
jgi:hypothetical protein